MPALSPDDLDAVAHLVADVGARLGHAVIDEHRWNRMRAGDRSAVAGLVARAANDDAIAYAQVTRVRSGEWAVDVVVHPMHRGGPLTGGLADAAVGVVRKEGGGHVQAWVAAPLPADDEAMAGLGLTEVRDVLQLARPLPADAPADGFATRPFVPGEDDDAWLALNNELFAWHPEQSGWTHDDLAERVAAPWFDPAGFLLHHDDAGHLDGFCWTKVHGGGVGEIYVIAGRRGLGRPLVLAGLDDLHRRRGCTEAILYSDAGNERAVALYEGLGFGVDHVNRSFGGAVDG
jgi:mycothiol synthase